MFLKEAFYGTIFVRFELYSPSIQLKTQSKVFDLPLDQNCAFWPAGHIVSMPWKDITLSTTIGVKATREADTKITFFLKNIRHSGDNVIRCSDTEILMILLGNLAHIPQLGSQLYVNVTSVYEVHFLRGFASVSRIHWL
ncbi:unnamed protein product [Psylliodes chrysocephalus]|uniref:Uncharacterized protein n=1 Tax=Psylliodes chrysocephalus TaxID=3402493 RepID=A0A9P0GDH1_9CUCU|nr:unnamed protein product [Psylliodes chrysocephala]